MASIRPGGEGVVATSVKLVERHSARQSGRLIIDFTTVAPSLMKLPLSAWKASISLPSLESKELASMRRPVAVKMEFEGQTFFLSPRLSARVWFVDCP